MSRFDGRVAVITGGARGIGLAAGHQFAADGAAVALLDLDEDSAIASAASLPGGERHIGIGADVTNAESVESAVQRVVDEHGRIDILINNAGITRDNLLFKMSDEDWSSVLAVHLGGAFFMSRAVQRHFVAQRSGKIVNISSTSALGNRGQANYSAAKMGIQGFTRTLAIELGQFGVNVNAVAPGFVVSDMTEATAARLGVSFEEFQRGAGARNPIGRIGQPEDIAAAVTFLASDAASFITGQTIYADGGQTLV